MIQPICKVIRHAGVVVLLAMVLLTLNGCHSGAIAPRGQIAATELKLIIFSIKLMLIVVIPVIFMACWFGWRYREGSNSKYTPEWNHSTILEIVWWTIPCIIILILGTVTWKTTHSLDPYKPLDSQIKPVTVEVVSLDWKWLFIYPEHQIATLNYLKIPADTPINFKITAASPMNSFIIPQLGGQIYAMTGMKTQLHLIADNPGNYRGLATNYTGIGFAEMSFNTEVTSHEDFINWVNSIKSKPNQLTSAVFWEQLAPKSINVSPRYFGSVDAGLFDSIIMHYMMPDVDHKNA
ncbi:ubiquinol oxidase subunit II [Legionella cardiaca]|uniref:Ubiquinol oxidase subunit 2 n=1 Tax=Legionella cardiaca TaxID=1071983 RepID=A0ABY8ARJ8_9GAMM|nr:ubiquinol oxidase subunit II [Legionella cardiaca]WED42391.1 ubiquinol oxidase subunit II [Legionella cardiaca]